MLATVAACALFGVGAVQALASSSHEHESVHGRHHVHSHATLRASSHKRPDAAAHGQSDAHADARADSNTDTGTKQRQSKAEAQSSQGSLPDAVADSKSAGRAPAAVAAAAQPSAAGPPSTAQPTLTPLRVVLLSPQPPFASAPTRAAAPARPHAKPHPNAAPAGQTSGVPAPAPGLLPPVAVLPGSAPQSSTSQPSLLPVALLAAFVAILLVATVLTARRRT